MVLISDDLYAKHFGLTSKSSYEAILEPGADAGAVPAALEDIVGTAPLPVRVMTGEEYIRAAVELGDSLISVLLITALVMIACAAIAMLNTMTCRRCLTGSRSSRYSERSEPPPVRFGAVFGRRECRSASSAGCWRCHRPRTSPPNGSHAVTRLCAAHGV